MKEVIVTGKHYRVLADSVNNIWHRISYWTKASDVEFDDGSILEGKVFGHCILERNKDYAEGDIAYCTNAPSWVRLHCIVAGTSASTEPAEYASIENAGTIIEDGTAQFVVADVRPTNVLSDSQYQVPSSALVKSVEDKVQQAEKQLTNIDLYVGDDGQLHFKNVAGADSVLPFNPHGASYLFPVGDNGSTKDLGEVHKVQHVGAREVYTKGYSDGMAKSSDNIKQITYTYHHHTLNNESADSDNQKECPYADNYKSKTKGGCFTKLAYHVKYSTSSTKTQTFNCVKNYYGENSEYWAWQCPHCGYSQSMDMPFTHQHQVTTTTPHDEWTTDPNFHASERVGTAYVCACGKKNGQLATQTIDFN